MTDLLARLRAWYRRRFGPRHTLEAVAAQLVAGLRDGSIVLDPPLEPDPGESLPGANWLTRTAAQEDDTPLSAGGPTP